MMKKIAWLIIPVLLMLLPALALGEIIVAAENERLILHYDTEESQIILEDKLTGESWRSTPDDIAKDKQASGVNKINRQSDLIVQYHNNTYVSNQINSYTGSIKKGDFTFELIENGVEIRYYFPKQGFIIPVRYVLEESCLKASILSDQIEEGVWPPEDYEVDTEGLDPELAKAAIEANERKIRGKYQTVMNVSFLPFMGAGGTDDEGYLIIPDGSGALIRFNSGRRTASVYQRDIYGRDSTLNERKTTTKTYDVTMPVFGIVRNGRALLAVVENGEYQAQLNAMTNGQQTGYSNAYFSVSYTSLESNTIIPGSEHSTTVTLGTNLFRDMGDFTVRYYPLAAEEATYVDVAAAYRKLLGLENKPGQGTSAATQLELIASIPSVNTFLGVPYEGIRVLSSYDDAAQAVERLKEEGVNALNLLYTGWSDQSVRGKLVTSLDLDSRLGGKKAFQRLQDAIAKSGATLTLTAELLNMYRDGNGYLSLFAATDNVNSTAKQMTAMLQSTGTQDATAKTWYLLSPDQVPGAAQKLGKAVKGQSLSLSMQSMGNMIYSSFGVTGISRTESGVYWKEALASLEADVTVLSAREPAAYAFPYLGQADDVPMGSGRWDVFDEDIPFYQLVTHGAMTLFSEPVNEASGMRSTLLKAVEWGMYPSWRLIAGDTAQLSGTDYAGWYAASLDAWEKDVIETSAWLAPLGRYETMAMTDHRQLDKELYAVTYENGDQVLVNYAGTDAVWDGLTVPARSYAIKEAK